MITSKAGLLIDLEELTWNEARTHLIESNPLLVQIIDSISPGNEYKLYKARYRFGDKIFDKAESYLPLINGGAISFNDSSLPTNIKENLSYDPKTGNPVGIISKKNSEFFLSTAQGVLPYAVMEPGQIFGLSRILDILDMQHTKEKNLSPFIWEFTAGVRSIFMLPKITENIGHNKLKKKHNLSLLKPQNLSDHWSIFKDIANQCNTSWRAEILFFSNNWFKKLSEPTWLGLYCYFLKNNRLSYEFWNAYISWQITFNTIEHSKNMKFSQYTLNTARHLFAIAAGSLPAFRPATSENSAPINLLQETYTSDYGMSDYYTTIMEATNYNPVESLPVYYSLNYPTLVQADITSQKGISIISMLDELHLVMKKYKEGLSNDVFAQQTSLYKTGHRTNFSFYHHDPFDYDMIKDVVQIGKYDSRFIGHGSTYSFPKYAPFLRGCVKISPSSET